MSALPPEADMLIVGINVCFVPLADISQNLSFQDERCFRPLPRRRPIAEARSPERSGV
jgi:hypothetical protein